MNGIVISAFHFIRPAWLLAMIPLIVIFWLIWWKKNTLQAWHAVCDSHLLTYLIDEKRQPRRRWSLLVLWLSLVCMIIALAGPTWSRLPVPTYRTIQPRVVVLDLSDTMLLKDLEPDRLTRAKFKLHDLFQHRDVGQFGLVVYTGEPFVVSPLTDDAETIDALLSSLTPDVMPVDGQTLSTALIQGAKIITDAGFHEGQLLVLTAGQPTADDMAVAKKLANQGIHTSVMPMIKNSQDNQLFNQLATAGHGALVVYSDTSDDLARWLNTTQAAPHYGENSQNTIAIWRDEGRWFLIPALLLWLPLFRRNWLQRIRT